MPIERVRTIIAAHPVWKGFFPPGEQPARAQGCAQAWTHKGQLHQITASSFRFPLRLVGFLFTATTHSFAASLPCAQRMWRRRTASWRARPLPPSPAASWSSSAPPQMRRRSSRSGQRARWQAPLAWRCERRTPYPTSPVSWHSCMGPPTLKASKRAVKLSPPDLCLSFGVLPTQAAPASAGSVHPTHRRGVTVYCNQKLAPQTLCLSCPCSLLFSPACSLSNAPCFNPAPCQASCSFSSRHSTRTAALMCAR